MSKTTVTFTNSFADGTTRTLTIGPFTASKVDMDNIKTAVKDLNNNPATISALYLSKDGANFTAVKEVKLTTSDQTILID